MFVIGYVNYKSSIYMETQLKIYEYFAGEPFRIIIVDNSMNLTEYKALQELVVKSSIPIDIAEFSPPSKYSSAAHGEGLQYLYELACEKYPNAEYFLTQDPDFFWVKPQFLTYLKNRLKDYNVVGAPYASSHHVGWSGHPWFPAAFGAAYRMNELKDIEADFRWSPERRPNGKMLDPGWQIREKLCSKPYFYFKQRKFEPVGNYSSFRTTRCRYYKDYSTVAYHLGNGSNELDNATAIKMSRGSEDEQEKLKNTLPPDEWQNNRKKMCNFFWEKISGANE